MDFKILILAFIERRNSFDFFLRKETPFCQATTTDSKDEVVTLTLHYVTWSHYFACDFTVVDWPPMLPEGFISARAVIHVMDL